MFDTSSQRTDWLWRELLGAASVVAEEAKLVVLSVQSAQPFAWGACSDQRKRLSGAHGAAATGNLQGVEKLPVQYNQKWHLLRCVPASRGGNMCGVGRCSVGWTNCTCENGRCLGDVVFANRNTAEMTLSYVTGPVVSAVDFVHFQMSLSPGVGGPVQSGG